MIISLPHVREELLQFADRRGGDLRHDAGQVALGIEAMPLGAGDEGVERRGGRAGPIMPLGTQYYLFSPRGAPFFRGQEDSTVTFNIWIWYTIGAAIQPGRCAAAL